MTSDIPGFIKEAGRSILMTTEIHAVIRPLEEGRQPVECDVSYKEVWDTGDVKLKIQAIRTNDACCRIVLPLTQPNNQSHF